MRIASYNVENLFQRAKALNLDTWFEGKPVLEAQAELNALFNQESYTQERKQRMVELLQILGLTRADDARYARLRKLRGRLLRRPRAGGVEVVADGRADWIGWVELKTEPVDDLAMQHTAMVIRDVAADVLGVVEADDRPTLQLFSAAMLELVGGVPYEQVLLLDGNDDRGIDVGLMARPDYPVVQIRTHIFDTDDRGVIFSRDCCEYHLRAPNGRRLVVLVNHLKSKGFGSPGDPIGAEKRRRQAVRVAAIYRDLRAEGIEDVAVLGDLNDSPDSQPLAPLLAGTDLTDVSEHRDFDPGERLGTYQGGNRAAKIDYILLSPALFGRVTGGGIFRRGVWHGPRTQNPWQLYETLTEEVHAASDHAAIWAELAG
jgi:endonuclease/exonuclease/phosphatase family metal-dependent hydrolase